MKGLGYVSAETFGARASRTIQLPHLLGRDRNRNLVIRPKKMMESFDDEAYDGRSYLVKRDDVHAD